MSPYTLELIDTLDNNREEGITIELNAIKSYIRQFSLAVINKPQKEQKEFLQYALNEIAFVFDYIVENYKPEAIEYHPYSNTPPKILIPTMSEQAKEAVFCYAMDYRDIIECFLLEWVHAIDNFISIGIKLDKRFIEDISESEDWEALRTFIKKCSNVPPSLERIFNYVLITPDETTPAPDDGAPQTKPATDEANADTLPLLPKCLARTPEDEKRTRATFENAVQAGYMERTPNGYKWTHDKGTELAFICGLLVSEDLTHSPDTLQPHHHTRKKWMYGIFPRNELHDYFGLDMGAIRDRRQQAAYEKRKESDRGIITPPKNYKELLQLFPDDLTEK